MDENVIYVGIKPFTNYVMALITMIARKKKEIKVIARGKFISKAVDIVEVAKNRFSSEENRIEIINIKTDSEKFIQRGENGREREITVSVIEITVKKKNE
ncbi:hypothetical protein LCGC14_0655860 [marine sediment metagenome]|uniref:DNA/RNA-binding protein Alba-like domain-containing protein n=1 Tax=marine sediment metagenome TaxID=412755 RepID=A0A0F9REV4_9ZZZZ